MPNANRKLFKVRLIYLIINISIIGEIGCAYPLTGSNANKSLRHSQL